MTARTVAKVADHGPPACSVAERTAALRPGQRGNGVAVRGLHTPSGAHRAMPPSSLRGHDFGRIRVHAGSPRFEASIPLVMRMTVHRSAERMDVAHSREVPSLVHQVLRSDGGRPLERTARAYFEPLFRQSFADVRVHADPQASASARAIGARAYAAGSAIVFGAPEQYDPRSVDGRRLLAHELMHVVQQRTAGANRPGVSRPGDTAEVEAERAADEVARGRSPAVPATSGAPAARRGPGTALSVQRAVDFAEEYRSRQDAKVRSRSQEYEDYKRGIGKTEASSEGGGHKLQGDLQLDELLAVYTGVAEDLRTGQVPRETIEAYVRSLNQAFRVLLLDTVETQASYIANAFVESDQFRYMTETEASLQERQPYQSNPTQVKIATSWLDRAAKGEFKGISGYEPGGTINTGNWQRSFIGRGPIQVTHRYNYVQVIAILENRFEELEAESPGSEDAKLVREAIDQIKTDPAQAANPKYAFLVSAAFMKVKDPKAGLRGDEKATRGNVTSWMGPQFEDKKKMKLAAYEAAKNVLMKRHEAEQAEQQRSAIARTIRNEFWEYDVRPGRP